MTLDEAITCTKEISSREFNDMVHCIRCSEIHGYIAEWLEDYKRLCTEKEQDIYERAYKDGYDKGYSDGRFAGYNKAIDDACEYMKCEWAIDNIHYLADFDNLAELLKKGCKNDE